MPDWLIPHSPTPLQIGIEGIAAAVKKMNSAFAGVVSGDVEDWLKAAIQLAGVSSDWLSGLEWLAQHESSGNPHAVNPEGVNGQHAAGLMQMMPSTFAAYRDKNLPDDIFNPIANAVASIRYIEDVYGNIGKVISGWASRGGYAEGGIAWSKQLAWVGENGPEAIIPLSKMASGGGGASSQMTINVAVGGRIAEQIVVEGANLAARRGRWPVVSRS